MLANAVEFANPLIRAADHNDITKVNLLLERGADPNTRGEFGATAIMRAAHNGNQPMFNLLLHYGANPLLSDIGGVDAPAIALRSNHYSIIQNLQQWTDGAPLERTDIHHQQTLKAVVDSAPTKSVSTPTISNQTLNLAAYTKKRYEDDLYQQFYSTKADTLNGGIYDIVDASSKRATTTISASNSLRATKAVAVNSADSKQNQEYAPEAVSAKPQEHIEIFGFKDQQVAAQFLEGNSLDIYFHGISLDAMLLHNGIKIDYHTTRHRAKKACAKLMRRHKNLACYITF